MDGNTFHATATQANTEAFLAALTDLSVKYGIGITGDATLFLLEPEDAPYSYQIDSESKLTRR
jgi:hypothetical protein